jgi:hypothetical protein
MTLALECLSLPCPECPMLLKNGGCFRLKDLQEGEAEEMAAE